MALEDKDSDWVDSDKAVESDKEFETGAESSASANFNDQEMFRRLYGKSLSRSSMLTQQMRDFRPETCQSCSVLSSTFIRRSIIYLELDEKLWKELFHARGR